MFNNNVEPLENLIDQFAQFPGIGRKSAVRMAYQVMSMPPKQAMELAKAIEHAKSDLHRCRICQDYTTGDVCKICASQKRDRSIICVVEGPRDIKSIERTHEYNGLYHVLHGLISPMDGIGADQLCIKELLARLNDTVKEVIMATSPTVEGEATAMYIAKLIKPLGIKTTRLAYGLPVGSSLEYADETTLYRAMAGRGEMIYSVYIYVFSFLLFGRVNIADYIKNLALPELLMTAIATIIVYGVIMTVDRHLTEAEKKGEKRFA